MKAVDDKSLLDWLTFLKKGFCTCDYEYKNLGYLYGISMGKGWVLITRDSNCKCNDTDGR